MYSGNYLKTCPDRPAFIMAGTGESMSHARLDARSNQLAHLLRELGLRRLDHYAIFMENNSRFMEACMAGERSGLYYTCINTFLTAPELAYIINHSESQLLITSSSKFAVAREALAMCPRVKACLVVGEDRVDEHFVSSIPVRDYEQALAQHPGTPIADECLGAAMLYSSGTTGRPKGILRPLPEVPPDQPLPLFEFFNQLFQGTEGMVYLSPAPLYHSAPLANVGIAIRNGGTAIIMERFDAAMFLELVQRYAVTHTQLVPTMFSRMLKLAREDRERYDTSSLRVVFHAAAPCPAPVKQQMIEWWGPIIHEYYGATEGLGLTACNTSEWLAHPGTVGRAIRGELHILDSAGEPVAPLTVGEIWFKSTPDFMYFHDPEGTAKARSRDGSMATVGDMGYLDQDGYLYLTDRASFMIISGGVNIYPQECENLLITHPKVADAAVFGVPNEEFGEEVKAVIQPMPGVATTAELASELIAFCSANLARHKIPRSVDFTDRLPRLPTGKLYKRELREPYWAGRKSRIV